jgi:hypothetical protein
MAIDSGVVVPLFTNPTVKFDTVTVDLERPRIFGPDDLAAGAEAVVVF